MREFAEDIKQDILFAIITNLREEKMTSQQAKLLSRDFLAVMPPLDTEDLLAKVKELGMQYEQIKYIYIKYMKQHDEEKRRRILTIVRMYMQQGDFDRALLVAKGGI